MDKENRSAFLARVRGYNPRTLVFVDEFSFSDTHVPLTCPTEDYEGLEASMNEWTTLRRYVRAFLYN